MMVMSISIDARITRQDSEISSVQTLIRKATYMYLYTNNSNTKPYAIISATQR